MSGAQPVNRLGVHSMVWTGAWTEDIAETALASTRAAGYDVIELALLDPGSIDVPMMQRILAKNGLQATGSLGLAPGTDVSSDDPAVVAAGRRVLHDALHVVRDLGGDTLAGVLYSSISKYDAPPTERGRAHAVEAIADLADEAARSGIQVCLEVVNRYETNLLNTAAQALAFLDEVDRPNALVHLDTYHMNIEEPDLWSPVLACGDRLGYVHIGESHRGYLGSGHADLAGFCHALATIGYTGTVTFESFSSAVIDPVLSTSVAVWRNLWSEPMHVASQARQFMRSHLDAAGQSVGGAS